nr:uncharacterized protein K02A2.6-like [Dermacentor andersoni]
MSTMLAPLYLLLEKEHKWHWGMAQENSYLKAKQTLLSSPVLTYFDPNQPVRLECDASPSGLGAVISHRIGQLDKPIAFRSRTLTHAEKNYSQLEKEALALVFGVTKFRDYLLGREFILVTDHQPLVGLLREDRPVPPMASARIQRWALFLSQYSYRIEYKAGKENANADALSRLPVPITDVCRSGTLPEYVLSTETLDSSFVPADAIRALTNGDENLSVVQHFVLKGWPKRLSLCHNHLQPYFCRRLELSSVEGLLYWGHRIVVPCIARVAMLAELHRSHQGASAMKRLARTLFWWPGLHGEIESLARSCISCVQAQPMPHRQVPICWPETGTKWSRLHIDYAGPIEGRMLLIVVDSHTKWIEALPVKSATTEVTIARLRELFARFGLPQTVVSDNGPQFASQQFSQFMTVNNITHLRSAPYHPQSNGLAERAVRTIKDGLLKHSMVNDLETKLARVLLGYRRTPLPCGKSPSEMLLTYQIRSRLDTCIPSLPQSYSQPPRYQSGDQVWVRNFGQGERWRPGIVKSIEGSRLVTVDTPDGLARRHFDQIFRRVPVSPVTPKAEASESLQPSPDNKSRSTSTPEARCSLATPEASGAAPVPSTTPPTSVPAEQALSPPSRRSYGGLPDNEDPCKDCSFKRKGEVI